MAINQAHWFERSSSLLVIVSLVVAVVIINKQKQAAAVKAQSSLLLAEQQQTPAYPKYDYAFPAYVDATNRVRNAKNIQAEIPINHLGTLGTITVGAENPSTCRYLCGLSSACKQSVWQASTGLCELKSQISPTSVVDPEWVAYTKANPTSSYFSKANTQNFI